MALLGRHWQASTNTIEYVFILEGALLFGVASFLTKAVPGLGHAYKAKYISWRLISTSSWAGTATTCCPIYGARRTCSSGLSPWRLGEWL